MSVLPRTAIRLYEPADRVKPWTSQRASIGCTDHANQRHASYFRSQLNPERVDRPIPTLRRPITLRSNRRSQDCSALVRRRFQIHEVDGARRRRYNTAASRRQEVHESRQAFGITTKERIAHQLKNAISRRTIDLLECFNIFSRFDQEIQYRCYELLFRDRIIDEGINRFLTNPKLLLPIIDQFGQVGKVLKILLQRDQVDLHTAFEAFQTLQPDQQMRCYELLCRDLVIAHGINQFLENPSALLKRVRVNGCTCAIIDHLVNTTRQGNRSTHRRTDNNRPSPVVTSTHSPILPVQRPRLQLQVYNLLMNAAEGLKKDRVLHYWKMLDPGYQRAVCEHAARIQGLTGGDLVNQGLALLNAGFKRADYTLFIDSLGKIHREISEATPIIPNAGQISEILESAYRGEPYDLNAFQALIPDEEVNNFWPKEIVGPDGNKTINKKSTILIYIAQCQRMQNGQHLRPLLEVLANKGIDFNAQDYFGNTALLWAIAQANYDFARMLIEFGSQHEADFTIKGLGNAAIHLLLTKGYRTRSRDGQRFNDNASGPALLRLLLTLNPSSVNLPTDDTGLTPLHIAALRRDFEFCQILREFGADPHIPNAIGETPLDMLNKTEEEANAILNGITPEETRLSIQENFQPDLGRQLAYAIRGLFS